MASSADCCLSWDGLGPAAPTADPKAAVCCRNKGWFQLGLHLCRCGERSSSFPCDFVSRILREALDLGFSSPSDKRGKRTRWAVWWSWSFCSEAADPSSARISLIKASHMAMPEISRVKDGWSSLVCQISVPLRGRDPEPRTAPPTPTPPGPIPILTATSQVKPFLSPSISANPWVPSSGLFMFWGNLISLLYPQMQLKVSMLESFPHSHPLSFTSLPLL